MNDEPDRPHEPGDPPELDRLVDALRHAWSEVPDADRASIWSAIEGHLGPQDDPGRDPRPGFLRGALGGIGGFGGIGGLFHGNPVRQLAIAGAAAAVVGAVILSGALGSGTSASASVLEAVSNLSRSADEALNDDSLTTEELALLRARATHLLDEVDANPDALRGMSAEELRGVIDTLEALLLRFDEHEDEEFDDDDFVSTLTSIRRSSETARGVYDDEHEPYEDDDDDGPSGVTPVGETPAGGASGSGSDDGEDDDREDGSPQPTGTPFATGTAPSGTPNPTATSSSGGHEGEDNEDSENREEDEHPSSPTASPSGTPPATPTAGATATPSATGTSVAPGETTQLIPATNGSYSQTARNAGSVAFTFQGETLTVSNVTATTGWSASVEEASGSEIRVDFSSGLNRVRFKVERHDDQLEVTVRWWSVAGNG